MVLDNIKFCDTYSTLHKDFALVFDFIKTLDKDSPRQKTVLKENVWATVSSYNETPARDEELFEAHRDYIDIQCVISGREKMGFAVIGGNPTAREYDKDNDYELFSGSGKTTELSAGDFCILYPQDLHLPILKKLGEDELVRVVAKIKI